MDVGHSHWHSLALSVVAGFHGCWLKPGQQRSQEPPHVLCWQAHCSLWGTEGMRPSPEAEGRCGGWQVLNPYLKGACDPLWPSLAYMWVQAPLPCFPTVRQ